MLAARVDEHGDGAAVYDVEAAALQRKSFAYKIVDRRSEVQLAVEPRLYGVLVGGLHIFEMTGLQGTQMRVHDGGSQRGFSAAAAQEREQAPAEKHGEEKCGCYREPAPGSRASHRNDRGSSGSGKRSLHPVARRERRAVGEGCALESR